jgi:hypothetical protein
MKAKAWSRANHVNISRRNLNVRRRRNVAICVNKENILDISRDLFASSYKSNVPICGLPEKCSILDRGKLTIQNAQIVESMHAFQGYIREQGGK